MGITQVEWERLKENEKYAMIGQLFRRVGKLEKRVDELEGEVDIVNLKVEQEDMG